MYHRLEKNNNFNIPSDIFLKNSNFLLYFTHGNYIRDNKVGPQSGFATGLEKKNTLLRAVAEGIERRATMLGGKKTEEGNVVAWDILNNKINKINYENTTFKENEIDTSGSATHSSQNEAIYGAIKELYEKNSLFLFWYGKMGYRIKLKNYSDNIYYKFFMSSGYEVSVFFNDYFSPLKTVVILAYKSNDLFFCGLGTSNLFEDAIAHALEETFLIASFYFYKDIYSVNSDDSYVLDKLTENYIIELNKIPYKEINDQKQREISLNDLISIAPDFVKSINVIFIQQNMMSNLICIKVYIEGILNCLPKKKNISDDLSINKNTIKITSQMLSSIPDCPMS